MKNSLSALLVLVVTAASSPVAFAQSDVPASYPYYDAIHFVEQQGMIQPYYDGTFWPDEPVTRGEFVHMVVDYMYLNEKPMFEKCFPLLTSTFHTHYTLLFPDVEKTVSFGKQLCVAMRAGLVKGHPDGTFRPAQIVNLAEVSKMLAQAFEFDVYPSSDPKAVWYEPYIGGLAKRNALPKFKEGVAHKMTRGEVAQILFDLHKNSVKEVQN